MSFHHIPVLFPEVMEWMHAIPGGVYLDGTLGGGGHSEGILESCGGRCTLYGIDRDPSAREAAGRRLSRFPSFHALAGNFHDARAILASVGVQALDGALLDLGVSSPQLDQGERGFSYHVDAPLDMRMDPTQRLSAREIVNTYPEKELTRILEDYGEEKWAARISRIICEHRAQNPLETTMDLVRCVDAAIPRKIRARDDGHPARRTFQAIRIAVNDELDPLDQALCDLVDMLHPGGRLLVITFHSLEDRIVKRCFQRLQHPCICPPKAPICTCGRKPSIRILGGGAIKPSQEEICENPRSRSSILRVCEKREVM
ncbi:MAG: 16S rRNA (cytosine(1402)-N(4))-methyltransferase RsmH [Clostridia bacterium]|nr:16S rRNA (cytosine(1402)-N(4))-methyltransferase RsmH [Clostridia bacterium]